MVVGKFSEHKIKCPFCGECKASAVFPAVAYPANPLGRPFIMADCKRAVDAILFEPSEVILQARERYGSAIAADYAAYRDSIPKPLLELQVCDLDGIAKVVEELIGELPRAESGPRLRVNLEAVHLLKKRLPAFVIDALIEAGIIIVDKIEKLKTKEQLFDEYEVPPADGSVDNEGEMT